MPIAFRSRHSPFLAKALDTLNRPDSATLGSTEVGKFPWEVLSGTWSVSNKRLVTSTADSSNPLVAVSLNSPDVDATLKISSGGGDSLYFRIVDASNWLRARSRRYQVTTTTFRTEYEWSVTYVYSNPHGSHSATYIYWGSFSSSGAPSSLTDSHSYATGTNREWEQQYFHNYSESHPSGFESKPDEVKEVRKYDGGTNSAPFFASSVGFSHLHGVNAHTHSYLKTGSPYKTGAEQPINTTGSHTMSKSSESKTGATRQVESSSTSTHYQVIVEKNVAATITSIGSVAVSAPNSIRVVTLDADIDVHVNGSANPTLTVAEATHKTATKVGVGRGVSDLTGHSLSYFSAEVLRLS